MGMPYDGAPTDFDQEELDRFKMGPVRTAAASVGFGIAVRFGSAFALCACVRVRMSACACLCVLVCACLGARVCARARLCVCVLLSRTGCRSATVSEFLDVCRVGRHRLGRAERYALPPWYENSEYRYG